ncbi:hypothetical protein XELAEV_18010753mg [Xenopus laevis]|uniref:Uncharacterized protein n=1 Tax=Xenopus laevis TaxID=8355 RepID=A0A974DV48_XENLA|nr:hypothetical protein XELAEV_18010753mg [Xenopus laevis]
MLSTTFQANPAYCTAWERDLPIMLPCNGWKKIWMATMKASENVAIKEISYKLMTRCACFDTGTLLYPWELLHNLPITSLNRSARHLTKHVLSTAKWNLAISWLSPDIPWQQIVHEINAIYAMEELTARIQDNMDNFLEIWTPWKDYMVTRRLALQ